MATFQCIFCGKHVSRKKNGTRDRRLFCSVGCSNRHRLIGKTHLNVCSQCGGPKSSHDSTANLCLSCRVDRSWEDISSLTLGGLRKKYSTAQFHAKIRGLARQVYKKHHPEMKCEAPGCNYRLHVDVAHIKPVASL